MKDDKGALGNMTVELIQGSVHQSSHIDALIHAQRHGRLKIDGATGSWLRPVAII